MNFYWYKQKGRRHSEKSVLNKRLNNIQTFSYRQRRLDCYVGPKHLRFLWFLAFIGRAFVVCWYARYCLQWIHAKLYVIVSSALIHSTLLSSWLLSQIWNIKTHNPKNSEPQNVPRRGLDFIALNTWVSIVYRTFLFMIDPKDKFWDPLNVRISIFLFSNIQRNLIFHPIFELFIC